MQERRDLGLWVGAVVRSVAGSSVFLEFGQPLTQRESKALEGFASSMQLWAELRAAKKIEDFRTHDWLNRQPDGAQRQRRGRRQR